MNWEVSTMPSKKSYFNPALYRKNLSRFWPLWGGVSLVGCVAPLYMLLTLLSRGGAYIQMSSVSSSIYALVTILIPGFLLVYASLCGVLTWGYLSNARSVGLYHTLPVSRTCLFFTSLASGLTMMLLPFLIVGTLSSLVLLCFGILPLKTVAWAAVLVIGMCVLFFSLITLAAMVSGNSFAVLAFYYLGNFLAAILDWLLSSFSSGFLFGIANSYTGRVEFFSPVLYIYNHFTTYYDGEAYQLSGTWCIGVYALVGIVLLALSLLLYRRRKSESAGDVVAQSWLKPIFRYGVALLSGLTLGQVLYTFVYTIPFGASRYKSIVPMAVCVLVTALLGYYVASMLLKKSLRVFRGNWQGPLTTAAIVVILCGCVSFDVFGSVSYVPDLQEVDDVIISFYDRSFSASGDSRLAQEIAAAHRAILKDEAYIRSMTSDGGYAYTMDESGVQETMETTLYLSYRMKDGTMVQRRYDMPLVRDRWYNQPDTFDYLLRQAVYGPEASDAAVTPVLGDTLDSLYGEYWNNDTGDVVTFNLTSDGAQRIYDGLLADAAAGTLYDDDIFRYDYYYNNGISGNLEFSFRYWSEETMSREVEFVRVDLSPTMTNTMAALKEEVPEWFAGLSEASQLSAFPDTVSAET